MAASLDGLVAGRGGAPVQLSDDVDLRRVHALRAEADAILVGVGTVLRDDPSLRVQRERIAPGAGRAVRDPLRVVLDAHGRTPAAARVADGGAPSLFITADAHAGPPGESVCVAAGPDGVDLGAALAALAARGVGTVLVEGGPRVMRSFLAGDVWDRFTLYVAPRFLGEGVPLWPRSAAAPPELSGSAQPFGEGVLWSFTR
jgi:diaminohydroxyphosphoribosylaminopyrimidine deaminase/5-amino-6-(5-phosphoribosylamino)uracil reductase